MTQASGNEKETKLSPEEARMLIQTIEEVEREEAASHDRQKNRADGDGQSKDGQASR